MYNWSLFLFCLLLHTTIDAAIYEDGKQMTKTAAGGWAGL